MTTHQKTGWMNIEKKVLGCIYCHRKITSRECVTESVGHSRGSFRRNLWRRVRSLNPNEVAHASQYENTALQLTSYLDKSLVFMSLACSSTGSVARASRILMPSFMS